MVDLADPSGVKTCRSCRVSKPLTEFHRRGEAGRKHKYRSACKVCYAKNNKQWNDENQDRLAWLHKMKNIEAKYGVTREWYEATLIIQDDACVVCTQKFVGLRGVASPAVDHCHTTGKVRGIICNGCNAALGYAQDDPARLRALAGYLENA